MLLLQELLLFTVAHLQLQIFCTVYATLPSSIPYFKIKFFTRSKNNLSQCILLSKKNKMIVEYLMEKSDAETT